VGALNAAAEPDLARQWRNETTRRLAGTKRCKLGNDWSASLWSCYPPVHRCRSWRRPCTRSDSSKYSWVCFVSSDYYKLDGTKHRLMSIHARRIQNRSWSRERPNM